MADGESKTPEQEVVGEVTARYVQSPYFRVIHGDGVWGGTTPAGFVQMAFYSETFGTPAEIQYKLKRDHTVEESKVTRKGIKREVEIEIILSVDVAKAIRDWLDDKIAKTEAQLLEARKAQQQE